MLPEDAPADKVALSIYEIPIKKGILFAPHPAFAKDEKGNYVNHHLSEEVTKNYVILWICRTKEPES